MAKVSPSFFFHDAIPPSVMVGLIAGILNGVRARRRAEAWKPEITIEYMKRLSRAIHTS